MTVLVTGAAGFIGFHLSTRLLERGTAVLGFDNVNPYFTPLDTSALESWTGFKPNTPIQDGVTRFVAWYREFYGM